MTGDINNTGHVIPPKFVGYCLIIEGPRAKRVAWNLEPDEQLARW